MGVKQWVNKLGAGVAVAGLLAISGAVPAQALSESGRKSCNSGGGFVGLQVEQQRFTDTMYFNVGGRTTKKSKLYKYGFDSGLRMTQNWKGESVSLLLSGTYGYCYYPY